jgi:hypothetical protein
MDAKLEVGGTRSSGPRSRAAPTRKREQDMAWIVSTVQSISLEEGAPELPGFFVGQSTSSAELTFVFEDVTTAEECANAIKRILDRAVGIRARV